MASEAFYCCGNNASLFEFFPLPFFFLIWEAATAFLASSSTKAIYYMLSSPPYPSRERVVSLLLG
jgi:hypothetical protein